jgi:hypothetical protein
VGDRQPVSQERRVLYGPRKPTPGRVPPNERIRIEFGVPFTYHAISGVTGLDDRQRGAFNGVDFELRYRLLDRAHAPFALTFGAEPHWARVDDISGEPVANYGSEFSVALRLSVSPSGSRAIELVRTVLPPRAKLTYPAAAYTFIDQQILVLKGCLTFTEGAAVHKL